MPQERDHIELNVADETRNLMVQCVCKHCGDGRCKAWGEGVKTFMFFEETLFM